MQRSLKIVRVTKVGFSGTRMAQNFRPAAQEDLQIA